MNLSLDAIGLDIENSIEIILESKHKSVDHFDLISGSEGSGSGYIIVSPIHEYENYYKAFLSLLNFQLHFDQAWELKETTKENVALVLKSLIHHNDDCRVKPISSEKIKKEISYYSRIIQKDIIRYKRSDAYPWKKDTCGIFLNKKEIHLEDEFSFCAPQLNHIVEGISLSLEWNTVEFFYKTKSNFNLFVWCTSG